MTVEATRIIPPDTPEYEERMHGYRQALNAWARAILRLMEQQGAESTPAIEDQPPCEPSES